MKNKGSEPGFRTELWPAKGGHVMVKHMDDQHLQNAIVLMQRLHVGARRERSVLAARGKRIVEHMKTEDVEIDDALQFVREKMSVMKRWIKTLKKERSYRKHRGITVGKGSIIMPDGMTRAVETRHMFSEPFDPNKL